MSYRNCVYIPKDECIKLFHWSDSGQRIVTDYTYNPYCYIETTGPADATSIFNTPLKKKVFRTQYDRMKYIKDNGVERIFENISPVQQFLIDMFQNDNESPDFDKFPLKIQLIDIEYYVQGAFAKPENPTQPINVITIYDFLDKKFTTFGLQKDYTPTLPNSTYIRCADEKDLLEAFLKFEEQDHPDLLGGWNSDGFDIPYIINRITRIFGEDYVKRLSPVQNIYSRTVHDEFGRDSIRYIIDGVTLFDYLNVYKTFQTKMRESYKLNDIAELEIGEKKIDYGNIDLGQLADNDWQKFVDYNIQDVNLLVKMEEKLLYLKLLRMLAYVGLTPFDGAMGTLTVVTGAAVLEARKQKQVVSTFVRDEESSSVVGAFVAEPQRGFQNQVVSFDVNSLYPNTMITLNLSPETKLGEITEMTDDGITIKHITGKTFTLTRKKFDEFLKIEQVAVAKSKTLFSQKRKGIFPKIVDKFYDKRVKVKKEMKSCKKRIVDIDNEIEQLKKLLV